MLEIRLLGQFEIVQDGKRVNIPTRNAQTLFAYLVLNAGRAYRRERLAGLLWPDSSEENARSNLRHELWRLRKAIGAGNGSYFLIDDLTIAFNPQSNFSLDVHKLENISIESNRSNDLIEALSNYGGDLLPGFYEEWVLIERDRFYTLFEARIARLLQILESERRWMQILDWGMRWIALGQGSEIAYRALMSAYAGMGDLSKIAATYERLTQTLQQEQGIGPSVETQELYKRLKAGFQMDRHMEKQDSKVYQGKLTLESAASSFPIPKVRHTNLPEPMTSFIGREKEIQEVEEQVQRARFVTITGSGGVGKTRLAIQVGSALVPNYRDGAWWVELASLFKIETSQSANVDNLQISPFSQTDKRIEVAGADLVIQAVAKILRIPDTPGRPLIEEVLDHLHTKQLLLILDNCEHLIDACAYVIERVLRDSPEVSILATSREALSMPGEKAWRLPSLSLPGEERSLDSKSILQSEAVRLFIERGNELFPANQLGEADVYIIAQICRRLDGIPLAIELAAARLNLLSAQEIAARLDRRFSLLTGGHRTALPRHQTLRAAIEWSYDLLSVSEQLVFRRLSIFAGSCSMDAAEAVCSGEGIRSDEVLTLLGRLSGKSLLSVRPVSHDTDMPTRYYLLDTIRSFGQWKLDEAEETAMLRDRHAAYYVHLVEAAEPELLFQNQVRWFKLLQAENDNLRAAIEWSLESKQTENALRMLGALLWFWFSYGSTREGRDLAIKVLASPSEDQFDRYKEIHAKALNTAGFLHYLFGDTELARKSLEEAVSIQRTIEDKTNLAWSLQFLGLVLALDKEYNLADATFQEGLDLTRKLGGVHANNFLHFLGDIDMQKGDRARAKRIYEESASILRTIGSKSFLAYPLRRLGYMALNENNIPIASGYFRESLSVNREVGDKRGIAACLTSLAALAIHLGKPVDAARLYGVVESRLEFLSVNLLDTDQMELANIRNQISTHLDQATFTTAFTEGWEMGENLVDQFVEDIFRSEAPG
ncbi:MAG TPA: tetratricopeptide repeat protein [Anaerolineaceae bacterium]|nr:tetratricopeptide repeat protein [Anaerolineaceae bacterium]